MVRRVVLLLAGGRGDLQGHEGGNSKVCLASGRVRHTLPAAAGTHCLQRHLPGAVERRAAPHNTSQGRAPRPLACSDTCPQLSTAPTNPPLL